MNWTFRAIITVVEECPTEEFDTVSTHGRREFARLMIVDNLIEEAFGESVLQINIAAAEVGGIYKVYGEKEKGEQDE